MEKQILQAAIQDRAAYNKIASLIEHEDFTEVSSEIWHRIEDYYTRDERATSVDLDLFKTIIREELPKHAEILIQELESFKETSAPNIIAELVKLKRKALANEIIQSLAYDSENVSVIELMDKYASVQIEEKEDVRNISESARDILIELSDTSNLIKVYPKVINDALDGGLVRGSHVVVFARPNLGKTMFNVNLCSKMAKDGWKVLHLINEEPKKQLLIRYINRLTGLTKREVYQDIDEALILAEDNGLDNVYIEDINPGTFHEIRSLIEQIQPDVVVIDQLRNIKVRAEGRVLELEKAAQEARNIAKKYDIVVVSVTQAGDSATNKLVLSDSDIDSSKTGIPATADLIIGIGADDNQKHQSMRTLTIVKNKVTSVHDFFPVRVNENLSKVLSI